MSTDTSPPRDSRHHVVLGAGPVGRAVVEHLAATGARCTIVTRSATSLRGAASRQADLNDPIAAKEALRDADVVYQCSQPEYHRWPDEFPGLQRSIVQAAAAAGAVVVATENVYGYGPVPLDTVGPLTEDLPLAATTRKGAVRAEMWRELEQANAAGTVHTVAARAADFYGPFVRDSMLGERFFEPLLKGKKAEIVGDPDRLHTVTYVPDLAAAMVRLGGDPEAWGQAWHIPNAPTVTTTELVALAAQAVGVVPAHKVVKRWQLRLVGPFMPSAKEIVEMYYEFDEDFVVDHSKYAARYGANATPLAQGLAATVAWYRTQEQS